MTSDFDMNALKYYTISPRLFKNNAPKDLYDKAFKQWSDFWGKEYTSYGSEHKLDPIDFYRQDIHTFITYQDQVIATNSLSFFDLSLDLKNFPYLNFMYPTGTFEELKKRNLKNFMTLQFLMVDSRFRYKVTKINIGGIIVSLSIMHQKLFNICGSLTAARTEVRAAKLAEDCGFSRISDEKSVHNVPVVSMLCTEPQIYPALPEANIVNRLWENKTNYIQGENYEIKHAA